MGFFSGDGMEGGQTPVQKEEARKTKFIEELLSERLANDPKLFRECVKKFVQAATTGGKGSRSRGGSGRMGPRAGRGRGKNGFGDDDLDSIGSFDSMDGNSFMPDGFGGSSDPS